MTMHGINNIIMISVMDEKEKSMILAITYRVSIYLLGMARGVLPLHF